MCEGRNGKQNGSIPNPGLIEYVESQHLIVRWKGRRAFFRDEENHQKLQEENERQGFKGISPITEAVEQVFESVGELGLSFANGILSGSAEVIQRVRERARITTVDNSLYAYTDRHGILHLPFRDSFELAKAFCAAEPSTVLVGVEATEREWTQKASEPGGQYIVSLLNEYRASWAILRQWAGHDAAIAQREARIQQLERLVWDAIYALQKGKLDKEADQLRQIIQRP